MAGRPFLPRTYEQSSAYYAYGRNVHPVLALVVSSVLADREIDYQEHAEKIARDSASKSGVEWPTAQIEKIAHDLGEASKSNLKRLKAAFGAAVLFGDLNFLDDVALIVRKTLSDPSVAYAHNEFFRIYWAALRAKAEFGEITPQTVLTILKQDKDPLALREKEIPYRLDQLGLDDPRNRK